MNFRLSSRFNSVFMFGYFMGGALGSFCGNVLWDLAGWNGVCGLAVVVLMIGIGAGSRGQLINMKYADDELNEY
ncbi:hypothetical protein OFA97_11955 [Lactiplantibacillus plantarum]|nr:hypothetical protein OFA97_11955 [Lactiplantibacillus plantarum]